jgi:hypothetical protein
MYINFLSLYTVEDYVADTIVFSLPQDVTLSGTRAVSVVLRMWIY